MKRHWVLHNGRYKLGALFITLVLWVIVLGSKNVDELKTVPLQITTPKDLLLVNDLPDSVTVRFSGPKAFLRALMNRPDVITVDLAGARSGSQLVRVPVDTLKLPLGVRVLSVTPSQFSVRLEPRRSKVVPIVLSSINEVPQGSRLEEVRLDPASVTIEGPESAVDAISLIRTDTVDLATIQQSGVRDLPLVILNHRLEVRGDIARVRASFRLSGGEQNTFRVRNIVVGVAPPFRLAKGSPGMVTVIVRSSVARLSPALISQIQAKVVIPDRASRRTGPFKAVVAVDLPPELGLVRVEPTTVLIAAP